MDLSFDCLLKYKWTLYLSSSLIQEYPGEPEPWSAIVGSNANFWDLEAIPGAQLGANSVQ
jgi:hypothetical protein